MQHRLPLLPGPISPSKATMLKREDEIAHSLLSSSGNPIGNSSGISGGGGWSTLSSNPVSSKLEKDTQDEEEIRESKQWIHSKRCTYSSTPTYLLNIKIIIIYLIYIFPTPNPTFFFQVLPSRWTSTN